MAGTKKGSSKSPSPTPIARKLRWILGPGRLMAAAALLVVGFLAGWHWLWQRVGSEVVSLPEYRVPIEAIELTPLPAWIHTDVRGEAYRDLTIDGPLSILDETLAERTKNAFALHPWIARVERVEKRAGGRLVVEVTYRQPVCMVEFGGELHPVDGDAVLLPSADFSPVEKQTRYLRLAGIESGPMGPVGTRWGNPRVSGGAEIAAVLLPVWEKLGLERILPSAMPDPLHDYDQTYEVLTRRGTWIFWGHVPSSNLGGEQNGADKRARLERYFTEHATLEGTTGPQKLDLTRSDSIEVPASPAADAQRARPPRR